tara:strand:- start:308 stop:961 length:654 start_codon:yes stop_codon:yes gene_type:complete
MGDRGYETLIGDATTLKDTYGYSSVDQLLEDTPAFTNFVIEATNALTEEGLEATDENVLQYLQYKGIINSQTLMDQSFNNVGGDTYSAIDKISSAIGQYESGGNYKAVGPEVKSGMYKGDHAYGKYQIMGKNIPSWSKEALGYSVSKDQFLASPDIQDKIAFHKMGRIYDQYRNVEDVASVWFSGKPLAKAGNVKDVLGTSVPKYVKNIRAIYNTLT